MRVYVLVFMLTCLAFGVSTQDYDRKKNKVDLRKYGYANPLDNFTDRYVAQPYLSDHYFTGLKHTGVDFMGKKGESIYSICNGVVYEMQDFTYQKNNRNRNNRDAYYNSRIVIQCSVNNNSSNTRFLAIYGHVDKHKFEEGEIVKKGDKIAEIAPAYDKSNERNSRNDHLHFGINVRDNYGGRFGTQKSSVTDEEIEQLGFRDPFEYLSTHPDIYLINSSFDGAGSIVRPDEKCDNIYGYGCYRDIAIMHTHINDDKSSTVVFQWKRNESTCKNLKIYSEYPIDAVLKQKPWYSLSFDKRYDISLNGGRENYVIISPSSFWTTLSITSKSPIYHPIKIFAECTDESANYSSYRKVEKVPYDLNILFNGAKWTGTGSLISTEQEVGYGKSIDVVRINSKENSISSFQWLASPSCSRLLIEGVHVENNTYYRDNSIPIKNIEIKRWDASDYFSVCYSLPCYIDKKDYSYYVIRINTKSYNGKGSLIMAQCVSN